MIKMGKTLLLALLLLTILCGSCGKKAPIREVFYLENDSASNQGSFVIYDFNGELASDSLFVSGYVFCRQQQLNESDVYYAVFPESNYVGLYNGGLEIRLFQHQQYLPSDIEDSANPMVAMGEIRKQKFSPVCGALQVLLKGHAAVTALRFTDNDTLDRLWGNYVVRHVGSDNQQIMALSSSEGNNEVWLDCLEDVELSPDTATVFTIMLPEGAFYKGFAMDVFCGDSLLYHSATDNDCSISRNKRFRMSVVSIL